MRNRVLALLLTAGLFLALAPAALGAAGYEDVPEGHWAAADIQAAREAGILTGIRSGVFGLGQEMNRAAFATALVRLFGWEAVEPTGEVFGDVGTDNWYSAAAETAAAHGAIPTYTGLFRPYDPVTREEMVTMLIRGLGYNALAAEAVDDCTFPDVVTNRGYIALAADLGLVEGYRDGSFQPRRAATREQGAAVLMRLHRLLNAASRRLNSTAGYTVLTIPTPTASTATAVPTTPLEPIGSLYTALRERKADGADMSHIVLVLAAGGWETVTRDGQILSSRAVSANQVETYLARGDVTLHYADQYESGYLTFSQNGRTVTVWYQSEESLAAKLQLARLFGVTLYCLD